MDRTLKSKKLLCKASYETLVRPILKYANAVWDPHYQADIYHLEMVQRGYARYACNDFGRTSSVTAMLQQIGWESLSVGTQS